MLGLREIPPRFILAYIWLFTGLLVNVILHGAFFNLLLILSCNIIVFIELVKENIEVIMNETTKGVLEMLWNNCNGGEEA